MPSTGEMDNILDPNPANAGDVEAGFHGENRAGGDLGNGKAGSFVDFQAQPVTHPVKEARPAAPPDFRGVTLSPEPVAKIVLGPLAVFPGS